MFYHLVRGDGDSAEKHRDFYDEYLAVMDLTAEFFLQTIERVFVDHQLPKGTMTHEGVLIDLTKIESVGLMTIEGEKDDITGIGQCKAALDLCSGVPAANKAHFECPDVGHYGVFNGSRFRSEIAPRIAAFVRTHDSRKASAAAIAGVVAEMKTFATAHKSGKRPQNDETAAFTFADQKPAMTASFAAAVSQAAKVAHIAEVTQIAQQEQAVNVAKQVAQVTDQVAAQVAQLTKEVVESVKGDVVVPSPLRVWTTAVDQWNTATAASAKIVAAE
jgi:poly(3-hydroxybutyrate) depolymerase